jgi:hypothetical protein
MADLLALSFGQFDHHQVIGMVDQFKDQGIWQAAVEGDRVSLFFVYV